MFSIDRLFLNVKCIHIHGGTEENESGKTAVLCSNPKHQPGLCVCVWGVGRWVGGGSGLPEMPRDIPVPSVHEKAVRGLPPPLLRSPRRTGQGCLERLLVELWNHQCFPSGGAFLFP